jgi:hypothetical protein
VLAVSLQLDWRKRDGVEKRNDPGRRENEKRPVEARCAAGNKTENDTAARQNLPGCRIVV